MRLKRVFKNKIIHCTHSKYYENATEMHAHKQRHLKSAYRTLDSQMSLRVCVCANKCYFPITIGINFLVQLPILQQTIDRCDRGF